MNKYLNFGMPKLWLPPKLLLMMRLIIVIMTTCLMQVSAAGFGQNITLSETNTPLAQVLKKIKLQSGLKIVYANEAMDQAKLVSIQLKGTPLNEALARIFENQSLSYEMKEGTIIVKKKSLMEGVKDKIADFFRQEDIIYKGIISDERGQPMAGASVKIKGASTLTKTNANGEFSIRGPREGILVVNFVGYGGQEIKLKGQTEQLKISMQPAATDLQGVAIVSTGLQDLPKERATGSFEVITAKQLQHSNSPNLIRRLEGITTSLDFRNDLNFTNSSTPNSMSLAATGSTNIQFANSPLANLTIRGKTNLQLNQYYTQTNQSGIPLVVIDNVASPYSIDQIDPETIESVVILKDAASTSIWGSRAANGVIVVKTKRGQYNTPISINFSGNTNITDKLDLFYKKKMSISDYISAEQYAYNQRYPNNTFLADPGLTSQQNVVMSPVDEIMNDFRIGRITTLAERDAKIDALRNNDIRNDYIKYFLRNTINQNYSLSIAGGGKAINYNLFGNYGKILNNTKGSSSDRKSITFNTNASPLKGLELRGDIMYNISNTRDQAIQNRVTGATSADFYPYTRLADDQGNALEVNKNYYRPVFINLLESNYGNNILSYRWKPLEDIDEGYFNTSFQTVNVNLGADYKILPWLTVNALYGYTSTNGQINEYYSQNSWYVRELINRFTTLPGATDPISGRSLIKPNGDPLDPFTRLIPSGGLYKPVNPKTTTQTLRGGLNINKNWNDKHELYAIAGVNIEDTYVISRFNQYYGYDPDQLISNNMLDYLGYKPFLFQPAGLNSYGKIPYEFTGRITDAKVRTVGVFSNASYTFNKKYTISASGRKDASSEFGAGTNSNAKPFYSFGTKWDLDQEKFYSLNFLPILRLRATYGTGGNVNSEQTVARPIITILSAADAFQVTNLPTISSLFATTENISNHNLRPEKTGQLNFGLDFGIKGNRVNGSVEYYRKKTIDLIQAFPQDPATGYSRAAVNAANLSGKGVELTLRSLNIKSGVFSWNSNVLFCYNEVKVTKVYNATPNTVGRIVTSGVFNEGYNINRMTAFRWAGLDAAGNPQGYLNGKVVSITNDAAGTTTFNAISAQPLSEVHDFGTRTPKYWGSFGNTLSYGQFSVFVNFQYKLGYYFRRSLSDMVSYGGLFNKVLQPEEYNLRWQKPGDELVTNVPSQVYTTNIDDARTSFYRFSEINVLNASHFRLQEINFSYFIKTKPGWFIKNASFSANLPLNIIIWRANKLGLDPETADYPVPKTYGFGFRASF